MSLCMCVINSVAEIFLDNKAQVCVRTCVCVRVSLCMFVINSVTEMFLDNKAQVCVCITNI